MSIVSNVSMANETKYLGESGLDTFDLAGFDVDDIILERNRFIFVVRAVDMCPEECSCGHQFFRVAYETNRTCIDIPIRKLPVEIRINYTVWRCRQCGKNHAGLPSSVIGKKRFTSRAIDFIRSPLTLTKSNVQMGREFGVNESSIRAIRKESLDESIFSESVC